MKTDELIVQLARSARPIRRLPPPRVRAVRWLAAATLVMTVAVVLIGPRTDLFTALGQPVFAGSLATLLLTFASGASAAFALSVPGADRSPARRPVPFLTAAAWSAIWLVVFATASATEGPRTAAVHVGCAIQIAVSAVAVGGLLFVMIARAAPLRPLWTAAVASLTSMATGAAVAQVLCPVDDPRHQLIGHVVVAVVVAGAGVLAGRRALKGWGRTRD